MTAPAALAHPAIHGSARDEHGGMTGSRPAAAQDLPEELVRRAAGGDTAAFARLVRLHNEDMTRVAFVIVGDSAAAAGATEAAWFDAWTGLRRSGRLRPSARGCVARCCRDDGLGETPGARGSTTPELDDRPTDPPAAPAADLPADDV